MAKKLMSWKTKGMNQDLSVSAFNPEFAFENRNLRLSTNEGNTMLSWVNERGTLALSIVTPEYWSKTGEGNRYENPNDESWTHHDAAPTTVEGTPIGSAILNKYLVLFTHTDAVNDTPAVDRIYRLYYYNASKTIVACVCLYEGNLKFSTDYPIETIVSYEAEHIQKVYWTDGLNQPRFINIIREDVSYNESSFDFINTLQLNENVAIKKKCGGGGMFPSGVIQYAFTYYQKYGQESNIFYTSPLLYISPADRAGAPDEMIDNVFDIKIDHIDENFDYLRIYSICRTSINGTPIVKRIQDISIKELTPINEASPATGTYKQASYTDTGVNGDSVDPTELLYKGGEKVTVATMEQKDNTLFLGNLKVRESVTAESSTPQVTVASSTRTIVPEEAISGNYAYYNQLVATNEEDTKTAPCCGFKRGNYYRLGIQLQDSTGKWSEPISIATTIDMDKQELNTPRDWDDTNIDPSVHKVDIPTFVGILSASDVQAYKDAEYKKIRAVVVFPNNLDRVVVCQGVSNKCISKQNDATAIPTIYDYQSSWFFRPYGNLYSVVSSDGDGTVTPGFSSIVYKSSSYTESPLSTSTSLRATEIQGQFGFGNQFSLERNCATFHSPDIEFDDNFRRLSLNDTNFQNIGKVKFTSTLSDIDIQTETPTISSSGSGFIHKKFNKVGAAGIMAGPFYSDYIIDDWSDKIAQTEDEKHPVGWMVYPWQRKGSINNDIERPSGFSGVRSAILKKKVISNYRYTGETLWRNNISEITAYSFNKKTPQLFNSDVVDILKLDNELYQGNVDTLLVPDRSDGLYFNFADAGGANYTPKYNGHDSIVTTFTGDNWWKTFTRDYTDTSGTTVTGGIYRWNPSSGSNYDPHSTSNEWIEADWNRMGDYYREIVLGKYSIRMKYKSSPHLILHSAASDETLSLGSPLTHAYDVQDFDCYLPILEIVRPGDVGTEIPTFYRNEMFGGISTDALKANVWIPCGEPVRLDSDPTTIYVKDGKVVTEGTEDATEVTGLQFDYSYGDTYFQRWDCMKTYPFTPEDENQIIEIGSFMLETYVNIDGRYDRNRGQIMNVSPVNFNLVNPVYSQINNFFSYKIVDHDEQEESIYPNQITWTRTKESGADVDAWTNITLASTLELDGDKGAISKLIRLDNQLLAFQERGISQILYNESVQIQSTDGVPIEIANSGKVQGKRYLSNTIGCSNKWSMTTTPSGIYFVDSNDKGIYLFNGQLSNISQQGGLNTWIKNLDSLRKKWTSVTSFNNIRTIYDKKNQDVLFIDKNEALAFSEKFGTFTSFYDYGNTPFFENLEDTGIFVKADGTLWKHNAGDYCRFFGENKPYSTILVGNPEPQTDKIFTNLEFRACVGGDGEYDRSTDKFTPTLPFDSLETWNEYQHGITTLENKNGHSAMMHGGNSSSLKRKYRMWRCDIPRDNVAVAEGEVDTSKPGLARYSAHPIDRMRNPWLYLELKKMEATDVAPTYYTDAEVEENNADIPGTVKIGDPIPDTEPVEYYDREAANEHNQEYVEAGALLYDQIKDDGVRTLPKAEIHDLVMTYFN